MGAQWKQAGRTQNASKRGAAVGKIAKEITVAAKMGDPHPENNPRLRAAIETAKRASVPRDTIERAIQRGAGLLTDQAAFELVTYEGFAPYQVPVIVECLTDNKNRTASDIRMSFRKGQLGSVGSVGWMFDRLGVVEGTHSEATLDLEETAIDVNAQNVETLSDEEKSGAPLGGRFFCDAKDLDAVSKSLLQKGWVITLAELSYVPKSKVSLNPDQLKEVSEFLIDLDDHDDVRKVFVALD